MTFAARPIGLHVGAFVFTPTISADTSNYNLKAAAIAAGWDQVTPLLATVTVDAGIVLSANSTSAYGFDTGSGFPVGTSLKLIMPGYVCGMGGMGGNGAVGSPTAGSAGGPALCAQHAITIDATGGVIAGGGGGGGGSDGRFSGYPSGGGGGGRTGRIGSPAGTSYIGYAAVDGTFSSGGQGGGGSTSPGGGTGGTTSPGGDGSGGESGALGGGGGGWGSAGGNGGRATGGFGGSGGAGGAAVVGNSYITWINTGTRYGAIT